MSLFSQTIDAERLARIPNRLREDWQTVRLLRNWRETLGAKLKREKLKSLRFRNNLVLHSPSQVDLGFLFHEIWLDGVYNRSGYEVGQGDIVIDIGANIGTFAIYVAASAPGVKVFAYEPFPQNFDYLCKNISDSYLTNVKPYRKAIAGMNEQRTLNVSDAWVLNSLSANNEEHKTANGIQVECITLSEILKETERCDLLKIDCEGSEYEIFYSCSPETLSKIRRIVGEYHEFDVSPEKTGKALCEFLESNSFRIDHFAPIDSKTGAFFATNTVYKRY